MVMELHLKKLLDQVKNAIRLKHCAYCTEKYMCSGFGAIFLFYGKASLWNCGLACERDR
jgi:hypothetical protein